MNFKKVLFFFSLLAWLFPSIMAAQSTEEPQTLVIKLIDGSSNLFNLADKPTIAFANGLFKVTSASASAEYKQDEVKDFTFQTALGIAPEVENNFSFTYKDNNHVVLEGNLPSRVYLYSSTGALVGSYVTTNGAVTIDLSACAPGVYVLKMTNKTTNIKIFKK